MYKRSEHPQVQYSLTELTKGLFYCLQFAPLHRITVKQICERAGITRRTFYRNCEEKEDLILYACDRLICAYTEELDFTRDGHALYEGFFHYWAEHRLFLQALHENGYFEIFSRRFIENCDAREYAAHREPGGDIRGELLQHFVNAFLLGGLSQMLHSWTATGFAASVDDLTAAVAHLIPETQVWRMRGSDRESS